MLHVASFKVQLVQTSFTAALTMLPLICQRCQSEAPADQRMAPCSGGHECRGGGTEDCLVFAELGF